MGDCEGLCDYVARQGDPSNWHGDDPYDWLLDQEVWECPHDALDGNEYCVFHTEPEDVPDDVDEGERFVEAVNEGKWRADDEERVRRRKEFVGATFGAFDIEAATLDGGDTHPIRLHHAKFAYGVNAENTVFEHSVIADGARFETGDGETTGDIGEVSFRNAEFGEVSFFETEFGKGEVSFDGAVFGEGTVSFFATEFGKGAVSFFETEFGKGEVSFDGTMFGEGEVLFNGAEFGDGEVTFQSSDFGKGDVLFYEAVFGEGPVSFLETQFDDGVVSFQSSEFGKGTVSFQWSEFGEGWVSFQSSEFGEGDISFDNATFAAELWFTDIRFDVDSTVMFTDAEFRDEVAFGSDDDMTLGLDDGERVPYFDHSLDFSGATFHHTLEFRSGTDTSSHAGQSDREESRFDFVFAGDVDFSNVTFPNGVDFSNTRFPSDVDFTDATLEDADFSDADVTGTDVTSAASFDGANLAGANFSRAELPGASFEQARLNRAELLWTNLTGAKLYGALLGDARINRKTEFWLDGGEDHTRRNPDNSVLPVRAFRRVKMAFRKREPYCSYDPRYRGTDGEMHVEKAGEVYATLENLASDNSLPGLASECFLGRKDVQLREYLDDRNMMMIARSFPPSLFARYGESLVRVLVTGAITVLICGLAYDAFGLVEHADSGEPVTLFEGLYFSGLTFTTLGYGDFTPANSGGQILAVAETSIGVVLLAILVFVFGRRATR